MNTHDGCASAEELDNLDGEETAILLIEDNEGTITRYGVQQPASGHYTGSGAGYAHWQYVRLGCGRGRTRSGMRINSRRWEG